MSEPEVCLTIDPGASLGKYLLFRKPAFTAVHSIPATSVPISPEEYDREKSVTGYPWAAGVVAVPTPKGTLFFRIGLDPVTRTAQTVPKWQAVVGKVLIVLGMMSRATQKELKLSLRVLLPLDEYAYRNPMFSALKYAMENGAQVNGQPITNIKIVAASCVPEGAGLVSRAPRLAAALMCGHCDLSFIVGGKGKLDLDHSFTVPGAGAIRPLRMSGLPTFNNEVEAASNFCHRRWKAFAQDGLTVTDVRSLAAQALDQYEVSLARQVESINRICRDLKLTEIQISGGSAILLRLILQRLLKVNLAQPQTVEQWLATELNIKDKTMVPRLVDPYLVWRAMPPVTQHFRSLGKPLADPRLTQTLDNPPADALEMVTHG